MAESAGPFFRQRRAPTFLYHIWVHFAFVQGRFWGGELAWAAHPLEEDSCTVTATLVEKVTRLGRRFPLELGSVCLLTPVVRKSKNELAVK